MSELIIDKPQALSAGQKFGQRLLTVGFWAIFIYLLRPLLAIFAWALGIFRFNEVMIVQEGLGDLLHLAKWYFLAVVAMALVFETWAFYNLLRFRGKNRRCAAPSVGSEGVATFFGVDARLILPWQNAASLHLRHDRAGNVIGGEAAAIRKSPAPAAKSGDAAPSYPAAPRQVARNLPL